MATNTTRPRTRSWSTFWLIFPSSALVLVMIAGATLAAAPQMSLRAFRASPTPQFIPWGPASIAKPTYTPSPIPTATATATPVDTPTSAVVLQDAAPTLGADAGTVPTLAADGSNDLTLTYPQDASQPSSNGKVIEVSISDQHLTAYDGGQLVFSFVASTGMHSSTRIGNFQVLDKIPNAYGSTWNIWMPDWLGIYYSGNLENGIHALPILPSGDTLWAGFLGTPISFGCVVLGSDEALQLYNWADIGTPVLIRW